VNETKAQINSLDEEVIAHKNDTMPHKTADGGYRWGLRINPDLSATLVYEEVVV
jgi:hypothetical protein